jgi:hypothetical protein
VIACVADGHGSQRCPRAGRGAELALEVAVGLLREHPPVVHDIPRQLVSRWRRRVDDDLARHPATPQEPQGEASYLLYGTTVAAASVRAGRLRVLNIGDGDVLLLRASDPSDVLPLRLGGPTPGWLTHGLSEPNATEHVGVVELDLENPPTDVVLLSTDGFGGAFADPDWHAATGLDLMRRIGRLRPQEMETELSRWCDSPARIGGDDVSLAVLARTSVFHGAPKLRTDSRSLGRPHQCGNSTTEWGDAGLA